jgi:hypothetical protein
MMKAIFLAVALLLLPAMVFGGVWVRARDCTQLPPTTSISACAALGGPVFTTTFEFARGWNDYVYLDNPPPTVGFGLYNQAPQTYYAPAYLVAPHYHYDVLGVPHLVWRDYRGWHRR